MKHTFFILTEVNLNEVGYNPNATYMFKTREQATAKMRELYEKAAKKFGIDDPYDGKGTIEYDFSEGSFAFIFGEYYLDIFENSIDIDD